MAKIRKIKRKRLTFEGFAFFLLIFSIITYFGVSLFTNTMNNHLTMEIQNKNQEISLLKSENKDLNITIQSLQNKERIYVVAQSAGLNSNQDNIIALNTGE